VQLWTDRLPASAYCAGKWTTTLLFAVSQIVAACHATRAATDTQFNHRRCLSPHPLAASIRAFGRGPLRQGSRVRRGPPSTRSTPPVRSGIRRHNASQRRKCEPGSCRSPAAFAHPGGPRRAMRKPGCFTGSSSANSTHSTEAGRQHPCAESPTTRRCPVSARC